MNDKTVGKPKLSKEQAVYNQCKINDFKAMMTDALNALDKVLDQRDLDLRVWGEKERNDFHTIFGTDGEKVVHIDMPIKGVPHIIEMKAVDVMRDCIRRIRYVRERMTVDSFINIINDPREVCAKVVGEPQQDYKVEIGINFVGRKNKNSNYRACSKVSGGDSQVSTLCHELSHIPKKWTNSKEGGMGTSDYDSKGIKQSPFDDDKESYYEHVIGACKLVNEQSELVFDNAYNIERYFEIAV